MKIFLGTLLFALVISFDVSDGSDQRPREDQTPGGGRKRRDSELPDHVPKQKQSSSHHQSSYGTGYEGSLLHQIQMRPMSDGNPGSSSRMIYPHTPRLRLDNSSALQTTQRQHMYIPTPPPPLGYHFAQSSGGSGDDWIPPSPDHDLVLTAQEAEKLLKELDSPQKSHGGDIAHHTSMPLNPALYHNQYYELVSTQQRTNAVNNPGSSIAASKGHGGARVGAGRPPGNTVAPFHLGEVYKEPLEREHDTEVFYMEKLILLWIYKGTKSKVEQASFEGMTRPRYASFYQNYNFLVRLDKLDDLYPTVVYVWQYGKIMAVRAPRKTKADIMEPTEEMWFIVFFGRYFRLMVRPGPNGFRLVNIELATKDGRPMLSDDKVRRVVFPYDIVFCIYQNEFEKTIQGAYIPEYVDGKHQAC